MLLFYPDAESRLEAFTNRWVSSRRVVRSWDDMHLTLDLLVEAIPSPPAAARLHLGGSGALARSHAGALLPERQERSRFSRAGWAPSSPASSRSTAAGRYRRPALAEVPDIDLERIARFGAGAGSQLPRAAIFQTGVEPGPCSTRPIPWNHPQALGCLSKCVVVARGPKPVAGAALARGAHRSQRRGAYTTGPSPVIVRDLSLRGERLVVQRYGERNVELERALKAQGGEIVEIPTYRWALPQDTGLSRL